MTLIELQKVLGERISIATEESIPINERKAETELSMTIASLAKQMINNADIVLRADRLRADGKIENANIEKLIQ